MGVDKVIDFVHYMFYSNAKVKTMSLQNSRPDYGPKNPLSQKIDEQKYRQTGENFYSKCVRIADALIDDARHFKKLEDNFRNMRFLPAGRVQNAVGAARQTTA